MLFRSPERGEEVTIDKFHFKVISANSRRVNSMQVSILSEEEMEQAENDYLDTIVEK